MNFRFLTLASAEYMSQLELALDVLASVGHPSTSVHLGCVDDKCVQRSKSSWKLAAVHVALPSMPSRRVAIGELKIRMLHEALINNHFILNFDLDCFFFADPIHPHYVVEPLANGGADLVAQDDELRVPGSFNFGLFAMAPTERTLRLIETMRFSYNASCITRSNTTTEACPIDQTLFQRLVRLAAGGVKENALKVAILPRKAASTLWRLQAARGGMCALAT